MAPSRTVLVGMPAVVTAIPPGRGQGSTRQTRFPKYAAWAAAFSPAGPAPITIRSYFAAIARLRFTRVDLRSCRPAGARRALWDPRTTCRACWLKTSRHTPPAPSRSSPPRAWCRWNMQGLSGLDRHMPVAQPDVAFALEHIYDLLCVRMPMLRVGLPGKNVHQSEALLATRVEITIGDPLDCPPVVDNRLDILGLSDCAFQHGDLLAFWCPAAALRKAEPCPTSGWTLN